VRRVREEGGWCVQYVCSMCAVCVQYAPDSLGMDASTYESPSSCASTLAPTPPVLRCPSSGDLLSINVG
jgi:hypothetical protein